MGISIGDIGGALLSPITAPTMAIGGSLLGGITGADQQAEAAQQAAETQAAAARAGIAEQRRQFDAIQKLMEPFVTGGTGAFASQEDLLGLNGPEKQAAAIQAIQSSPTFAALQQQGENAILQNASATGGLRGGNVQAALSQFAPNYLNQLINQQFSNLGSLSTMGQNAAANQGTAGMNTASNISNLLQQQGAATAGGQLAAGNQQAQMFNQALQLGGLALAFI